MIGAHSHRDGNQGGLLAPGRALKGASTDLTGEILSEVRHNPGRSAIAVLRIASNVADTETVSIGADVYEFDRANNGVTAGRIALTGYADDTPTNATPALVSAINNDGTENVLAIQISVNEVLIVTADAPGGNPAASAGTTMLAETMAGANNAWDTGAMRGGEAAGLTKHVIVTRAVNATEAALGNIHFEFDFAPTIVGIDVFTDTFDQAGGAVRVAWDGAATITGNRVTLDNSGATDWAAGNVVRLEVVA